MNRRSLVCAISFAAALALSSLRCGSSSEEQDGGIQAPGGGDAAIRTASGSGGGSGSGSPRREAGSGSEGGSTTEAGTGGPGSGSGSGAGAGGDGGGTGGPQSVLQRGNDVFRRATFTEPGLSASTVQMMKPDATFNGNATFPMNGNMQNQGTASVLYLEAGPAQAGCPAGATGCKATARAAGAGLFFAFPALGANPNVVAFDETTGLPVWTAHVTTGGDGIRGTPVIDPASRRLFVVTGNNPHLVHALSVDSGVEMTSGGWPVTLSKTTVSYNGAAFNSSGQNQHGASLLLNDILYIPFGGQYGDGGTYLGWIVAVDITNPTRLAGWATQSPRSGIWGSGGLASDGTNVFGVTGDTTSQPRSSSDSEEVVRVTGLAQFTRNEASVFVPTEWQSWDKPTADLDFGASTPAYVPLAAGSNPPGLLVAPAKAGRLFVLDAADLSAGNYPTPGGSLADLVVASTTAESVYTAPTIYTSASGLHATINVGEGPANCPAGTKTSSEMVISVLLQPGQIPIAKEVWCAPNSGGGHTNYPPISTTTDGVSADALVWFVSGSQLEAVDGDTGKEVVTTTGAACDGVPSMSFPIAVKNRIVVSALGHLCSWSVNGQ
jgi:hypothetical protein